MLTGITGLWQVSINRYRSIPLLVPLILIHSSHIQCYLSFYLPLHSYSQAFIATVSTICPGKHFIAYIFPSSNNTRISHHTFLSFPPSYQITVAFWFFDVGSSYHVVAEVTKCRIVHPLTGKLTPQPCVPSTFTFATTTTITQYHKGSTI